LIRRNRPPAPWQFRPGFLERAAHGRHRQGLHLIFSMEELETSPRGASPEPEPETQPQVEAAAAEGTGQEACPTESTLSVDELMATSEVPFDDTPAPVSLEDSQIKAILEAIVYVAEEPLTLAQIAASLQQPPERIQELLNQLVAEFDQPGHGVSIREVAGGGRKNVMGKPMLYKTTKEFLIQFGLKDLSELPSLKEFEEIRRMAFSDS